MAIEMLLPRKGGAQTMADNNHLPFQDETKKYLEAHPNVAEQLRKAEKIYRIYGKYLNLTQARIVVRESGASNTEGDFGATLLRTDIKTPGWPTEV